MDMPLFLYKENRDDPKVLRDCIRFLLDLESGRYDSFLKEEVRLRVKAIKDFIR